MQNNNEKLKGNFFILFMTVFIYILIQPIYIWTSGIPQLADYFGLILIIMAILTYKKITLDYYFLISILFIVHILFVNLFWGLIIEEHFDALKSSSWYIYNVLIMLVFIEFFKKSNNSFKSVKYAVAIAIILEFIAVIVMENPGIRAVGTYNNPNQLAYFSLLSLSLFYLVIKKSTVNNFLFWLVTIVTLLISFYSLSKITIVSMIVLITIEVFYKIDKKNIFKVFVIIISILFIVTVFGDNIKDRIGHTELFQNVEERFLALGTREDDTAAGRGYDRIINHPEYLIFGAGEVDVSRFDSFDAEIHSSFGNLLFSYGIIGLLFFITLLVILIKNNKMSNYYVLIPLIMYSLVHNGLRNPVFWIILAILYAYKLNENKIIEKN